MKNLFERFEKQSVEVEKILEKSIGMVRERKSPNADLCNEIGAALRELRIVYDEIHAKLPEQVGKEIESEASVWEIEAAWEACVESKQLALKAVLSEFIRVYSDEERYQKAIEQQLDEAKGLLDLLEKDEKANPDVSSFALFLQGVKANLDEEEELSHRIEDELEGVFSVRAISGLQKNKYAVRDENLENDSVIRKEVEESSVVEAPKQDGDESVSANLISADKENTGNDVNAVDEEENEKSVGLPGSVDTAYGKVSITIEKDTPAAEAHASKFLSKAKDSNHFIGMVYALNQLIKLHLCPTDKIGSVFRLRDLMPDNEIQHLVNQGYIGIVSFNINGANQKYYIPSSKTCACFKKSAVASFIKSNLKDVGKFPRHDELAFPNEWSPAFIYRCKMMIDHLAVIKNNDYPLCVEKADSEREFVIGIYPGKDGKINAYIPSLPQDKTGNEIFEITKLVIDDENASYRIVILVENTKEIESKASAFIDEDDEARRRIRFAVVGDTEHFYDVNGNFVEETVVKSVDEKKSDSADREEELGVGAPSETEEYASGDAAQEQDSNIIHPIKPIPKLREPSNARFDDVLRTTNKLFVLLHDKLTFLGLMDESDVIKAMERRDYSADKTIELLNYLENKGYLCTYEYEGRNIICFTELMWSCLHKTSLQNLIKRRFEIDNIQQCIMYGIQDMQKDLFVSHLKKADQYTFFIDKLNRCSAFTDLLPTSRWNEEKLCYCIIYPFKDPETGNSRESVLTLFSSKEYVEREVLAGDSLICYSEDLPLLDNINDDAFYMCLTEDGLYFINDDEEWEALAEYTEEKQEADVEIKTQVVPEKVVDNPQVSSEEKTEGQEERVQSNTTSVDIDIHKETEELAKGREEKDQQVEKESDETENLYLDDLVDVEPEIAFESEVDDTLKAAELAKRIMDNIGGGLPSDEDMFRLIRKLLSEGERSQKLDRYVDQITEAIVLAKLLSNSGQFPVCEAVYKQLQAALPIFRDSMGHNGLILVDAFTNETEITAAAKLCAYIYGMLFPASAHDYVFASLYKTAFDEYELQFPEFSALKNLYHKAMKCLDEVPSGYSPANLLALADSKGQMERMKKISHEAKALLNNPTAGSSIKGLPELIELCFGSQSDLHTALEIVNTNDASIRELAEHIYMQFCDDEGELDSDKLDRYIDDPWAISQSKYKYPMDLKYNARKHVMNALKERLVVIKEWLDETATTAGPDIDKLRGNRIDILQEIGIAVADVASIRAADQRNLVLAALEHIRNKLQNQLSQEDYLITLLRSGCFILENGELILNDELDEIRFAEPWRNMLRHIACTDYNLFEVYSKILDADADSFLYDNYYQLKQIGKLIGAKPEEYTLKPDMQKKAVSSANLVAKVFKEKLEISYAYNRITENDRERLAALANPEVSEICGYFYKHNAFGCWRAFLDALRMQIREASQLRSREVKRSLDQARETLKEGEASELLDEAERLIAEKQNFAVAEEYINRFNNHERSVPFGASDGVKNYFLDFISESVFNNLYSYCEKRKDSTMAKIGNSYLESNRPEGWTVRHFEDARQLLQKWPTGTTGVANVPEFIGSLGFVVENSSRYKKGKDSCFTLTLKRTEKNKADYRHPIAKFGTQLSRQMDVVCLFGKRTANQLIDDACDLGFKDFFIVILDSTLALAERRRMAEYFFTNKNVGQSSFIVIDRLLALYLAMLPDSERLPALLQCTLPYTIYQPFTNGSGSINDEMFFGRVKELQSIRDMSGSSIVFGGRQLGKSALLERVEHLDNKPSVREYVVRTTIGGIRGEKALVENLISACNEVFNGFTVKPCDTLVGFVTQIKQFLKDDRIAVLRLLMDESDDFFDSISVNNYLELGSLIELQRNSDKRFKFVFAGLHDVCRAENAIKENGQLGQLGASVCVTPLTPADARNLLVRPLRYIGFKITNESQIDTILTNTNYYPGIIQYFGYTLVQTLASQYTQKYNAAKGNPPFELHDDQLADIMNSENLNEEIKKRLRMTLDMDERYHMLARCITVLYHWNGTDFVEISAGFDTASIREVAELYDIHCLTCLDAKQTTVLLDEMEKMGILSKPNSKENRYLLRRRMFIDTIGPKFDELENEIEENNKVVTVE